MPYRVVIFGSGSQGNCLMVSGPGGRVLVDLGYSQRSVVNFLATLGLAPGAVDALLITHTHSDHVRDSSLKFCWRHQVALVTARENLDVLRRRFGPVMERLQRANLLREIGPAGLELPGLAVQGFEVPHDSEGLCLGYQLTVGNGHGEALRLTVATDLGHVTPEVSRRMAESDLLVLESNHDPQMLVESGRPPVLIDRIAGELGHLSNPQTAQAVEKILAQADAGRLKRIVLAHLSQECNHPDLALQATRQVLADYGEGAPKLLVASQEECLDALNC